MTVQMAGARTPLLDHRVPEPGARSLEASRLQEMHWPQCRPGEKGEGQNNTEPGRRAAHGSATRVENDPSRWEDVVWGFYARNQQIRI